MKHINQLADDLETRALTQEVISYNKLARIFGLGRVSPGTYHSHPFCAAFGRLDEEDLERNHPLRTALVFSEVLNRPGNGFFLTLSKRRGITISEPRQQDEWTQELRQLQEHYKRQRT